MNSSTESAWRRDGRVAEENVWQAKASSYALINKNEVYKWMRAYL